MSDTIAIVQPDEALQVAVSEGIITLASSNLSNPSSVESIGNVGDVDTSAKTNGSVLVYKTITNKWTATRTLDLQIMEGGEF
jgi:hypothetical protein